MKTIQRAVKDCENISVGDVLIVDGLPVIIGNSVSKKTIDGYFLFHPDSGALEPESFGSIQKLIEYYSQQRGIQASKNSELLY